MKTNNYTELSRLNNGDTVLLSTGQECEFIRLKRKRFIGIIDGTSYDIPVSQFEEVLKIKEQVPADEKLKEVKAGDLFYIERKGNAELLIFKQLKPDGRTIVATNPIDKGRITLDKSMFEAKIEGSIQ